MSSCDTLKTIQQDLKSKNLSTNEPIGVADIRSTLQIGVCIFYTVHRENKDKNEKEKRLVTFYDDSTRQESIEGRLTTLKHQFSVTVVNREQMLGGGS